MIVTRENRRVLHCDTDPCPVFIPHWSDDLFGHIDDVLDLIGQANQEHPIASVELAKKLDLGWEEVWAIVWHLRSVAVPVRSGYGFWLSERMPETEDNPQAQADLLSEKGRVE